MVNKSIPLSIVIPVYNEGENIRACIEGVEKHVKVDHEIIIVYDLDNDNSIPIVKKLQNKYPRIKLLKNKLGRGVLNAIKSGMADASGLGVLVTMADLSDDPKAINAMIKKFNQGYDIVCGSRYMRGGKKIGGPRLKSFLSWLSGITGRTFLGLPTYDMTNSFKLYRKTFLHQITIQSTGGFELGMEIVLKAHFMGKKITEVPTVWYDRSTGKSRFKLLKWLPKYLYWYFWGIRKKIIS